MTTWAIGDLHGCIGDYRRLLERIGFDPARDRVWFVGDLVNRGPASLACLRAVRELGDRAVCVDWLRRLPLLHHDDGLGYTLVHAGLHRDWDLATARAVAGEVESILRSDDYERLFEYMYGDEPEQWSPELGGWPRIRCAINIFTRMRYCRPDGSLDLGPSGPPGSQPQGLVPWFDLPDRANADLRILFGHWSTLGYHARNGAHCLDSGCLWGGRLTALALEAEPRVVQVECEGVMAPG